MRRPRRFSCRSQGLGTLCSSFPNIRRAITRACSMPALPWGSNLFPPRRRQSPAVQPRGGGNTSSPPLGIPAGAAKTAHTHSVSPYSAKPYGRHRLFTAVSRRKTRPGPGKMELSIFDRMWYTVRYLRARSTRLADDREGGPPCQQIPRR